MLGPGVAVAQTNISGYTEVTSVSAFDRHVIFAPGAHLRVVGGGTYYMGDGTTAAFLQMQGDATISTDGSLTIQQIGSLPSGTTLRFGLAGQPGTISVEGFGGVGSPNRPIISVDGGVLEATTGTSAPYFAIMGPTFVASGARLDFGLQTPTLSGLSGAGIVGGSSLTIRSGSFDGLINVAHDLNFTGDFVLNGQVIGAEAISVSSGKSLSITASNALESSAALLIDGSLALSTAQSIGSLEGSGSVAIAPGTILTVGSDNTSTLYTGTLSGVGSGLTKVGTGTQTLAGTGTYTGLTQVDSGTLAVSGGSAISDQSSVFLQSPATLSVLTDETIGSLGGQGAVTLSGNLTTGGDNISTALSGPITGSGGLVKTGTGTFFLSGINTNTGGLAVNQGVVQLSGGQSVADGAILSASGTGTAVLNADETVGGIAGNGTIALDSNTITVAGSGLSSFSGALTGTGDLVKTGSGRLVLSGANSLTGPIQISDGTLEIGNGGTTGSLAPGATITNDATLVVNRSNDLVLANRIIGSGGLVKMGAGTLTLDNSTNLYSGGIDIQAGTVEGNTLAIRGDIVNQGTLSILDLGSNTFNGDISGAGNVVVDGVGVLTLTGTNTFSGGMTIKNGKSVAVAADASLGALPGIIDFQVGTLATTASFSTARPMSFGLGNGIFEPSAGTQLTLSGTLSGPGGLRKRGAGVLDIAGAGTYGGTSYVDGGTLSVNGTIAGPVSVESGGRLGGNGTIGGVTVQNLGTLAPGNSIGTLNVNGAATFAAGSTYAVETNAAGQSDRLVATGAITIDPAASVSVVAAPGTYGLATTYTIATGASVTGTFAAAVTSNLAFLDAELSYDPTNVLLTLMRNDVRLEDIAETPNQASVASALASLPNTSALAGTIVGLSAPDARRAYDQVSGQAHGAIRSQLLWDASLAREAVLARMSGARDEQAQGQPRIWSTALAGLSAIAAQPDYPYQQQALTGGLLLGVDTRLDATTSVGAMVGSSASALNSAELQSRITAYGVHAGVYGAVEGNVFALRGGAIGGLYDLSSTRMFDLPGQWGTSSAGYTAAQGQLFGELAYKFPMGPMSAQAYLGLSHAALASTSFTETGSPLALSGTAPGGSSLTTATIGLRSQTDIGIDDRPAKLGLGVALRSAIAGSGSGYDMQLAGANGFHITEQTRSGPQLLLDLSLDAPLSATANAHFAYQANVGAQGFGNSAKATLSVDF